MNQDYKNLLKLKEEFQRYIDTYELEEMIEVNGLYSIKLNQKNFEFTKEFFINVINTYMKVKDQVLCSYDVSSTKVVLLPDEGLETFEIFTRRGQSVFSLNEDGFLSEEYFFKILEEVFTKIDNKIIGELK